MNDFSQRLKDALKENDFSMEDAQLLIHIWARNRRLRVLISDIDGLRLVLWKLPDARCILTLEGLDWKEGEGRVSTDEAIVVFKIGEDSTIEIVSADVGIREYYADDVGKLEELDREVLERLRNVLEEFIKKVEEENSPED